MAVRLWSLGEGEFDPILILDDFDLCIIYSQRLMQVHIANFWSTSLLSRNVLIKSNNMCNQNEYRNKIYKWLFAGFLISI